MSKCDTCKHKADDEGWMFCDRCIHYPGLEDMYKPMTNKVVREMTSKLLRQFQQPYESPTGQKGQSMDYISKPALMGKLTSSEEQKKIKAMTGEEAYNEFLMLVNSMEKADVAPVRHGRWEVDEFGFLKCTNCAWVRHGIPLVAHYPYCPNCGARMDGGADNGE